MAKKNKNKRTYINQRTNSDQKVNKDIEDINRPNKRKKYL